MGFVAFFVTLQPKGCENRLRLSNPPKGVATIRVQLIDESSMDERQEFAEQKVDVTSAEWKKYTVTLTSTKTLKQAKLRIFLQGSNSVALEHISLFPVNTYKNRENGMRRDLAQALEDLHPGIFRFPGGCIVEGTDLATRYQWKNSVGPGPDHHPEPCGYGRREQHPASRTDYPTVRHHCR